MYHDNAVARFISERRFIPLVGTVGGIFYGRPSVSRRAWNIGVACRMERLVVVSGAALLCIRRCNHRRSLAFKISVGPTTSVNNGDTCAAPYVDLGAQFAEILRSAAENGFNLGDLDGLLASVHASVHASSAPRR